MSENPINLAQTAEAAAVLLFRLGFTPIKVVGKNPAYGEGKGWQKTHYADENDVRAHFLGWEGTQMIPSEDDQKVVVERNRNVGVLCDGFVFLGCNTQESLIAFKEECPFYEETLNRVGNNPTPCAIFKRTDPKTKFWVGQKIMSVEEKPKTMADIWGDNSQFVAWGVHPKGMRYRFTNDAPILPISTEDIVNIVVRTVRRMGDGYQLKTKATERGASKTFTGSDNDFFNLIKRTVKMKEYLETTQNRLLCPLHKQGSSNPAAVIYENLEGDTLHCHSGGCHADIIGLHAKIMGIGRMEAALDLAQKYKIALPREINLTVNDTAPESEAELVTKINGVINRAKAAKENPDRGKIISLISHFVEERENFKTPTDTQVLYRYDQATGLYAESGESWLQTKVQTYIDGTIAPELNSTHLANEVVGAVKRMTFVDRETLEPEERYTPFGNGIYDFKEEKLLPFTSALFFTRKLVVEYKPDTTCPEIDKFLKEVYPESQAPLYELAGYICLRKNPMQKAWLLDGKGNNGKSTFINMLVAFIGKENTCSVALQRLENNRFATAEMESKYLNCVADMSSSDVKTTGAFKAIVGGDMIQAERKGQNPFRFKPWAKIVYSCNAIPDSGEDDSNAFFRRWVMLSFDQDFTGREDRGIEKRITSPSELSGLLNVGLKMMKIVAERGSFSGQTSVEQVRELYVSKSNSAKAFIKTWIPDYEHWLTKEEVFKAYCNFCKTRHLVIKSDTALWKLARMEYVVVEGDREKIGEKRMLVARGFRLADLSDLSGFYITPATRGENTYRVGGENESQMVERVGQKTLPSLPTLTTLPVRILMETQDWVGQDGLKYGSYKPGETVELPKIEAEWIVEHGFGEYVKGKE
jgi:putative DNA primase/helicase